MDMESKKKKAYQLGLVVLFGLAALTGIEYAFAVTMPDANNIVPLFLVSILKSAAIMQFFMHMSQLWSEGGH
jgi:hypothetical protein